MDVRENNAALFHLREAAALLSEELGHINHYLQQLRADTAKEEERRDVVALDLFQVREAIKKLEGE